MNTQSKRAFITGVYGQDGSYLAEHLLKNGYEVLGLVHGSDIENPQASLLSGRSNFSVCVGDLSVLESYKNILSEFSPDEIYNLAAISDLKTAKENPELTMRVNFSAFLDLVAYATAINPHVRIFQALSSRILTPDEHGVIHEGATLSEPKNAYDEAKRASYEKVVLPYREKGFFVTSGFLCNHESPRRGDRFVTGKIARTAARIGRGLEEILYIGNVNAFRDWSHAKDIVRAMHATLSIQKPNDYVIGSSELHTVREFIDEAFKIVGVFLTWQGEGVTMQAIDNSGKVRVMIDPMFYQPDDNPVVSNTQMFEYDTGWKREVSFNVLVEEMVRTELLNISSKFTP